MVRNNLSDEKPLVGFFPLSYSLAETGRAVIIAKRFMELGGKVIFFTHGGEYEYLIKKIGCKIIRVEPFFSEDFVKRIRSIIKGEKKEVLYNVEYLKEAIKNEVEAYKKSQVQFILTTHNYSCCISARVANIPLISITTGPGRFKLSIPDMYENFITRLIPQFLKIHVFNQIFPKAKNFLKPFNIVAKEYGLKPFKNIYQLYNGDITFVTNFLEFINIFPNQQEFPTDNYIGIIFFDELFKNNFSTGNNEIEEDIIKHIKKSEKSILVTMGSSGDETLFIKILNTLNKIDYRVIAVYSNILKENELPKVHENILLKKFVPSISQLHKIVDLSIIHGGQGTVFTAAYAGKPIIGFPMQYEQHLNLEKIVGHRSGLMLSKKYFNEKKLLNSIDEIFKNYNYFLENSQKLAKMLPKPEGDKKAAIKLLEIINKKPSKQLIN
ncbi:MAG: glycosyltransferase [Candidatus Thermoplasmatota archaeon]|jgi:UDP:flavonoid glycosyltransferase YjiC (YdhE family)|nr:glycosyltransferase [Candidatus Thermoplasmatota archaeon]